MSAPHPLTLAAAVRRAAIIAAGEARALQLTQTPRRDGDAVARLMMKESEHEV